MCGMMQVRERVKCVAGLAVLLLAGCATVPPDLPPVPVGPASPRPAPSAPAKSAERASREVVLPTRSQTQRPAPVPSSVPGRTELPPTKPAPGLSSLPPPAPLPLPAPAPMIPTPVGEAVTPPHAEPLADEVLRLQVLMDRANFSPGTLDGRWGSQTRGALVAWQRREGLSPTGAIDDELRARLAAMPDVFVEHVVTQEEHDALRPRLTGWVEKSAADRLGYATILEGVAERYHSTERAIREWNPGAAWPNPLPGTSLRVPDVRTAERVRAARVEIHLATKYLQAFDSEGRVVAYFPCSIARQVEKRPVGELHIANAAENPNYTFDPELFSDDPAAAGIGRKLIIPPGPNNPVGVAWLSLDRPGYGIHGTPEPEKIGKTESHGCFRLANWNARKFLGMVSIGTPVFVYE